MGGMAEAACSHVNTSGGNKQQYFKAAQPCITTYPPVPWAAVVLVILILAMAALVIYLAFLS